MQILLVLLIKKAKTAPRWDFSANNVAKMEQFLRYRMLYLTSIDLNPDNNRRIRIWQLDLNSHPILRDRYIEWMNVKGYPKFNDSAIRHDVNFQLFHLEIKLTKHLQDMEAIVMANCLQSRSHFENVSGSELIFKAEVINDEVVISVF